MTIKQKYFVFAVYVIVLLILLYVGFEKKYGTNETTPTASQTDEVAAVDEMSEEEKETAIQAEMQKNPPVEMSKEDKTAEKNKIAELMNTSTTILRLSGNFSPRVHAAQGGVQIVTTGGEYVARGDMEVETEGQKYVVFGENFQIDAGPDLHVFLSSVPTPKDSADLHANEYQDLGKLKNTAGAQMYEVPEGVNFKAKSVVIYCVPFKVVFGYADVK